MKKQLIACVLLLAALACKDEKKTKDTEEQETTMFPVTSFIEGQLHLVDSFQVPTLKYVTVNGKTDTSLISISEFKQIAREFLHPDINSDALKGAYKESSFSDQTINAVTFNYLAKKDDLEVRRVDVVVTPSEIATDKVRSIYMEKLSSDKDTSISRKLYWRTDRNFQIITTRQWGSQPPTTTITKVEWGQ